jgi:integrase
MAHITKKGKNRWLVRVFMGRTSTGKLKRHSKVIHGLREAAEKYARDAETRRDLGTLDRPKNENQTLNEFLTSWLVAFKKGTVEDRTYVNYEYMLDHYIRPYIGKQILKHLTTADIQEVYNKLAQDGLSPRTIALSHSILTDALNNAAQTRFIEVNPALSTRRRPRQKTAIQPFTPEQAVRFTKEARKDPLEVLFLFALGVGARPEEYCALQWPDLDLEKQEVRIQRSIYWPKGGGWIIKDVKTPSSLRTVAFNSTLARALIKHKRAQATTRLKLGKRYENNNLVFASKIGTPLAFRNIARRHLQPIMERAGIDRPINLYRMRHSFVTLSILAGADIKSVSAAAGHSSVFFTQDTYQHVIPAMRKDHAEKIGHLLFGTS